jgi:chemotaxis methyl-accepting protein methylase
MTSGNKRVSTTKVKSNGGDKFPIVGIGASAGGLEALELFLSNVPIESGMAFVIIQHLSPNYKGMLVELLQRSTTMQVLQAKDRMAVKANCVYVIPPNKDLSILHGILHLLDPIKLSGIHLPIDTFLRSLAVDQQENSIGVILSGMGTDGTLGLRTLKEKGGAVFVQEPGSAKFDGMPHSVIDAGLADVIAPAQELPSLISAYIHHPPLLSKPGLQDEDLAKSSIEKVMIILRSQTGNDFSLYKKTTVYRRIERRMVFLHLDNIAMYVRYLRENPLEVETLFNELLIGVTTFFRDLTVWKQLKDVVLLALLAERPPEQTLRAWVAGCSTGEEAYSLAILIKEAFDSFKLSKPAKNFSVQIFASDLDARAIEKAREGVYPANIVADVSPERLERYFIKTERGYQVATSIREMVIFAKQNIIMDPPFTKLDILCCRNLLIYLTPELQKKLLPLFHYSLNPGGILFLGNSETVGEYNDLFETLNTKMRLYRRQEASMSEHPVIFPTLFASARPGAAVKALTSIPKLQTLADQLLLQEYSPPAVLTDGIGDILYISGRTGKYMEAASGKANWNIFVMAREGLRNELPRAFQNALRQQETVILKNIVFDTDGGIQNVNVTIQPIREQNSLRGMVMIIFTDLGVLPKTKQSSTRHAKLQPTAATEELERELNQAHQESQSIREEMQTSQEELRSANEELQSTNEELQSTNEELTTSKEELQSINEELLSVNTEMQANLDENMRTNSDMKNLLDSIDIAILFLDNNLCVRSFTSQISKITQLIPGDVGRPITDIASALLYPQLANDANEVLRTLVKVERQISLPNGDCFATRILPYRSLENMINGVVITFVEITEIKRLEGKEKLLAELIAANQKLNFQDNEKEKRATELVIADDYLKKLTAESKEAKIQAAERSKELQAFYKLSEIVERKSNTLSNIYQEFIDILPKSWQYPEIACARIVMGDSEFRTKNFAKSEWSQSAPIKVNGVEEGRIEVGYIEKKPKEDEGPFLKEERLLLTAIAERLGRITERVRAEEVLQKDGG